MSKRPRAARSTKHTRPARPAGAARPSAAAPRSGGAAVAGGPVATQVASTIAEAATPRAASTRVQPRAGGRTGSGLLAQKEADEYVYVSRDLRHIGMYAAFVAAVMLLVWLLVDLAHVVSI